MFEVEEGTVRSWVWRKQMVAVSDGGKQKYVTYDEVVRVANFMVGSGGMAEVYRTKARMRKYKNGVRSMQKLLRKKRNERDGVGGHGNVRARSKKESAARGGDCDYDE